jgi:hypothetical protein
MKPILIRPNNTERGASHPSYVPPGGDESFDMLSYLTNEFENADIRAELIELSPGNSALQVMAMHARQQRLTKAAREVIQCWEGGDLAAAVRELDLIVDGEGA